MKHLEFQQSVGAHSQHRSFTSKNRESERYLSIDRPTSTIDGAARMELLSDGAARMELLSDGAGQMEQLSDGAAMAQRG